MDLIKRSNAVKSSGGSLVKPFRTDGLTGFRLTRAERENKRALQEITGPAPANQARTLDSNEPMTANIV